MFAAIMLMIAGSFQIIAGLAGIFENEFYAATPNYFLEVRRVRLGLDPPALGRARADRRPGAALRIAVGPDPGVIAAAGPRSRTSRSSRHPVWSIVVIALSVAVSGR